MKIISIKKHLSIFTGAFLLIVCIAGCNSNEKASTIKSEDTTATSSHAAETDNVGKFTYDLAQPASKWVLPDELKEISGNTWIDKDHLLAIEDLHSNLYLIHLEKDVASIEKTVPFEAGSDKKFDIEDVTSDGKSVYALWSHGVIFKITDWNSNIHTKEIPTSLDKKNNTEGICVDPVTGNLLVACKNESGIEDEKKSSRAIYVFDIKKEQLNADPFLIIERKDIKKAIGEKLDFNPSGIAVHPVSHDIYILSTKGTKGILVYSHDGGFKSFRAINEDLMPQPEGICFSPAGDLYISTEGKHGVPARLYLFNSATAN